MGPPSPTFGKPSQCLKAQSLEACACLDTCILQRVYIQNCLGGIANHRLKKKHTLGKKQLYTAPFLSLHPLSPVVS